MSGRPGINASTGMWRSLVAHLDGVQGVAGSNPVIPTIFSPETILSDAKNPFTNRKRLMGLIIPAALLALAVHVLHKHLAGMTWADLRDAFLNMARSDIRLSVLATIVSFLGLAAYDIFAVRVVAKGRMSLWSAAFAGMTGSAVSNTLGFHLLTGGAIRYRIFRRWGLELGDISRITALSMGSLALGYLSLITVMLFFHPFNPAYFHPIVVAGAPYLGVLFLGLIGAGLWWLGQKKRRIVLLGWEMPFPGAGSALQQMFIGFFEMGAAAMALYVLIPLDLAPALPVFVFVYIGSLFIGILSHTPGGIGVFEAGIMASLSGTGRSDLLAALLVYRAIYNLTPFMLGVAALVIREIWHRFR